MEAGDDTEAAVLGRREGGKDGGFAEAQGRQLKGRESQRTVQRLSKSGNSRQAGPGELEAWVGSKSGNRV